MKMQRWIAGGILAAGAVMGTPAQARAQTLEEIDWNRTAPASGRVVEGAVQVNAAGGGGSFPLVTIDRPAVQSPGYALTGEIRYQAVQGLGYVEMWSVFPDGGRYFSRTLAADGAPDAALSGTSDWREFQVPFFLDGTAVPNRLEINVVLPGGGRVWVGPLQLVSLDGSSTGWWTSRTAGLVGGIGGSLIGVLGAITGWLVSRRRARRFVLGVSGTLTALGGSLLVAGLVAVLMSQPYEVWFTLLLPGAILVAVFGSSMRTARRAYAEAELRRIRALDAPGSKGAGSGADRTAGSGPPR